MTSATWSRGRLQVVATPPFFYLFFCEGCRMSSLVLTFIWRYVADDPLISHPCETLGPVLIHLMNSTSTRPPVLIIVLSLFSFSLGLLTPADFSCMCVPHQTRLAGTCPEYVFVRGLGRLLLYFYFYFVAGDSNNSRSCRCPIILLMLSTRSR